MSPLMKIAIAILMLATSTAHGQSIQIHNGPGDNVAHDKKIFHYHYTTPDQDKYYKAMMKLDTTELENALIDIFYYMTNNHDFPMQALLKDTLQLKDTSWLKELDNYGLKITTKLKEHYGNTILTLSDANRATWDSLLNVLPGFDQNYYSVKDASSTHYPFLEKGLQERKDIFNNCDQAYLKFFMQFSKHAKRFPLKRYLLNRLKAHF